jgi:hypothetical protein
MHHHYLLLRFESHLAVTLTIRRACNHLQISIILLIATLCNCIVVSVIKKALETPLFISKIDFGSQSQIVGWAVNNVCWRRHQW